MRPTLEQLEPRNAPAPLALAVTFPQFHPQQFSQQEALLLTGALALSQQGATAGTSSAATDLALLVVAESLLMPQQGGHKGHG